MAENLDSQLKQMSEDLKEVVEHLNESNKNQELSNPVSLHLFICSYLLNNVSFLDNADWEDFECTYEFVAVD